MIDVLRSNPLAVELFAESIELGIQLIGSVVSKYEVLSGAKPKELKRIELALKPVHWVNIYEETVVAAAELARKYRKSHTGINIADYLIAATALEAGSELLTRNVKHYPMIKKLKAAY